MDRYVNYKTVIQRAELLAMSPESVDKFLKKRAQKSRRDWLDDVVDDDTEEALAARRNPSITLALARYGRHIKALRPMFQEASAGSATRLAILSNPLAGGELFNYMPVSLFATSEEAAAWLGDCPTEELTALFENPALGDSFLRDVLESKKPWDTVTDQRLATIVVILCRNPRIRKSYDQEERGLDGYSEYSHGAVFNAGWLLAGSVEVTRRWAIALSSLFENLIPNAFQVERPLEIAARWHVDPNDLEMVQDERKSLELGYLGSYQGVRYGLARLALKKDPRISADLSKSDDIALRAAVYGGGDMSSADLQTSYERDGPVVYNYALHNEQVWSNPESRNALSNMAWATSADHQANDLLSVNIFKNFEREHRKKHPDWFRDDPIEGRVDAGDEPATKADLQSLAEAMDTSNTSFVQVLENVRKAVTIMAKHVEWVWWFSLVALVLSLWRIWR